MKAYPVTVLCKVMRTSRSGFYQYLKRNDRGAESDPSEFTLKARIKAIFREHRGKYGARRIMKELNNQGHWIGIYKVRRVMRELGLKVKPARRYKVTTDSRHSFPVAPNLLNRPFDVDRPDSVWTADITYVWTLEGWMYLAIVMDLFSRRVVGWAMDKRMTRKLVMNSLTMALKRRHPARGLVHHSDQGSQYASSDFQELLNKHGIRCSMSRKGDCWDNAVAERFFRSLKSERTNHRSYRTRDEAKRDVIDYIEMFYNSRRLHSYLDYMSPNEFESPKLRIAA